MVSRPFIFKHRMIYNFILLTLEIKLWFIMFNYGDTKRITYTTTHQDFKEETPELHIVE